MYLQIKVFEYLRLFSYICSFMKKILLALSLILTIFSPGHSHANKRGAVTKLNTIQQCSEILHYLPASDRFYVNDLLIEISDDDISDSERKKTTPTYPTIYFSKQKISNTYLKTDWFSKPFYRLNLSLFIFIRVLRV
ncbi:MAG: hypothetical protein RIS73_1212 [Bacteroidota bacterium]